MAGRPNILLVHSDQHRWDCVGANGHPQVRTPSLDRLAREGVNFRHAFTPNPVCSPARACLQTGAFATTHGCITIPGTEAFRPARQDLPVLTALLAAAGYRVGHVGKFHREVAGSPTDHGAEAYVPEQDYRAWRASAGLPPQPRVNGWFGEVDRAIRSEQHSLHWQADRVLDLLDRDDGRPFFLRWDPSQPHLPNCIPADLADLYPPELIAPWPSFPDALVGKPEAQRRTRQRWQTETMAWEQWQPVVSRYLAEITLLDRQVGRLLAALDRAGLAERTLVLYSSDHGDMCGAHGMMDKHYVMYDDILRVPLFARWPGVLPAERRCDDFVIHELDLARTILVAAGVEAPPSFIGRDLVEDLTAPRVPPRAEAFAQYQGTHQGLFSQRALRDRRWKYVYNPASIDELYDLDADPAELRNLAADPAHEPALTDLRRRMAGWMRQVQDSLSPPTFTWRPQRSAPPAAGAPAHPRGN